MEADRERELDAREEQGIGVMEHARILRPACAPRRGTLAEKAAARWRLHRGSWRRQIVRWTRSSARFHCGPGPCQRSIIRRTAYPVSREASIGKYLNGC